MNRIDKLFAQKKNDVLAVYFTAGYPTRLDVSDAVSILQDSGADLVEIGMPFSDPIADGPAIQQSSAIALEGGMNLDRLFNELSNLRSVVTLPVVLMGYYNPVLQFGFEKFLRCCASCGIDGVILPDLPIEVYTSKYKMLFEEHNVYPVFLVSPSAPAERIKSVAAESRGFVYMVSSPGTTGSASRLPAKRIQFLEKALTHINHIPVLVGFGIHDNKTFAEATRNANGGVVGSALIRELFESGDMKIASKKCIDKIKSKRHDYSII